MDINEAKKIAKETLTYERYYHTGCVAAAAKYLAETLSYDTQKAQVAAYLHDIAKEFKKADLLQMIEASDIIELANFLDCPSVWHSFAGAEYARKVLNVDKKIAGAICYHTTARADMTMLEKIIFLADSISADREYTYVDEIREILYSDELNLEVLDKAILFTLEKQITRLIHEKRQIHYLSIKAYNFYAKNMNINGDNK